MKLKSDEQWQEDLSEEQYRVLRRKGTELPFSGEHVYPKSEDGVFACVGCGQELFKTSDQYESTVPGLMGWPSFSDVVKKDTVKIIDDNSHGMIRKEVVCSKCGSHLGHIFEDEESVSGEHYCINSVCLDYKSKGQTTEETEPKEG